MKTKKNDIKPTDRFVGIDVSKGSLDVYASPDNASFKFTNDQKGIQNLKKQLLDMGGAARIVFESTGNYHRLATEILMNAGLPVAVVNPHRTKYFAKSAGAIAKNDKIDAKILARFGEKMEPRILTKPDKDQKAFADLVSRRQQLVKQRVQETNHLECATGDVLKSIRRMLSFLDKEIKNIDGQIRKIVKENAEFKKKDAIIQSIPGAGIVLSSSIIAYMPELGGIDRWSAAALAGVAPFDNESGEHKGGRGIKGGRFALRSALYMATLAACRYNPRIKSFYERLIKSGKKAKVALVACMRKLLVTINSMLRSGRDWDLGAETAG